MKHILIVILLTLPVVTRSQNLDSVYNSVPTKEGSVVYEKVNESSLTATQLMNNARKWIAINFGDYNTVVKLDDQEGKNIIVKGITNKKSKDSALTYKYDFTLELNFRDEKYRIKIFDIKETVMSDGRSLGTEKSLEHQIDFQKNRKDKFKHNAADIISDYNTFFNNLLNRVSNGIIKNDDF